MTPSESGRGQKISRCPTCLEYSVEITLVNSVAEGLSQLDLGAPQPGDGE
jgi:hypothetical protein